MKHILKSAAYSLALFAFLLLCAALTVFCLTSVGLKYDHPSDVAFRGALLATLVLLGSHLKNKKRLNDIHERSDAQ